MIYNADGVGDILAFSEMLAKSGLGSGFLTKKSASYTETEKITTYFTYLSICVPLRRTYVAPYLSPFGLAARK